MKLKRPNGKTLPLAAAIHLAKRKGKLPSRKKTVDPQVELKMQEFAVKSMNEALAYTIGLPND